MGKPFVGIVEEVHHLDIAFAFFCEERVYIFCRYLVTDHLLYKSVEFLCVVGKQVLHEEILVVVGDLPSSVGIYLVFCLLQGHSYIEPFLSLCRPYSEHHGAASVALHFTVFYANCCHFYSFKCLNRLNMLNHKNTFVRYFYLYFAPILR